MISLILWIERIDFSTIEQHCANVVTLRSIPLVKVKLVVHRDGKEPSKSSPPVVSGKSAQLGKFKQASKANERGDLEVSDIMRLVL